MNPLLSNFSTSFRKVSYLSALSGFLLCCFGRTEDLYRGYCWSISSISLLQTNTSKLLSRNSTSLDLRGCNSSCPTCGTFKDTPELTWTLSSLGHLSFSMILGSNNQGQVFLGGLYLLCAKMKYGEL